MTGSAFFFLRSSGAEAAGSLPSRLVINRDAVRNEHALHESVARSQMHCLAFAAVVRDFCHDVAFVFGIIVIQCVIVEAFYPRLLEVSLIHLYDDTSVNSDQFSIYFLDLIDLPPNSWVNYCLRYRSLPMRYILPRFGENSVLPYLLT